MKAGVAVRRQDIKVPLAFPASVGGINVRDALEAMPPEDALVLINWVPSVGGLSVRKGWREWATGLISPVQTVFSYRSGADTIDPSYVLETTTTVPGQLFASTKDDIYDITSATDTPVSVVSLGGTDYAGYFSHTMLSNSAGAFLLLCAEDGGYMHFDGTTWTVMTQDTGPGDIQNVNPDDFVHVSLWKRRAWFVEKNSANVWYLNVDSIAGPATKLDLGPLMKYGGAVSFSASWTLDSGEGLDDYLVFVTEAGEVVVYQGTDPASASTFALVGVWYVGEIPKGRRGVVQLGGDVLLLSTTGLYPLSQIVAGGIQGPNAEHKNYVSKIQSALSVAMSSTFNQYGWQMVNYPRLNLLHIKVPAYLDVTDQHLVMQTTLKSWTEFRGIQSSCYGVHSGFMFGGTDDGRVLLLHNGDLDGVTFEDNTGEQIYAKIIPSFSALGRPSVEKRAMEATLRFIGSSAPSFSFRGIADFKYQDDLFTAFSPIDSIPTWDFLVSEWDDALWDDGIWGGINTVFTFQRAMSGVGNFLSYVLESYSLGSLKLVGVTATCEMGR